MFHRELNKIAIDAGIVRPDECIAVQQKSKRVPAMSQSRGRSVDSTTTATKTKATKRAKSMTKSSSSSSVTTSGKKRGRRPKSSTEPVTTTTTVTTVVKKPNVYARQRSTNSNQAIKYNLRGRVNSTISESDESGGSLTVSPVSQQQQQNPHSQQQPHHGTSDNYDKLEPAIAENENANMKSAPLTTTAIPEVIHEDDHDEDADMNKPLSLASLLANY